MSVYTLRGPPGIIGVGTQLQRLIIRSYILNNRYCHSLAAPSDPHLIIPGNRMPSAVCTGHGDTLVTRPMLFLHTRYPYLSIEYKHQYGMLWFILPSRSVNYYYTN